MYIRGIPNKEKVCVVEAAHGEPRAVITCNADRSRYFLRKVSAAGVCGEIIKSAKTPLALTTFTEKKEVKQ